MNFEKVWNTTKLSVTVLAVIGVLFAANTVWSYFQEQQQIYNEAMVKLANGVASKRVEFNEALFKEELTKVRDEVTAAIKEKDQRITDIGVSVAEVKATVKVWVESNKVYQAKAGKEKLSYDFIKIYTKDAEGKEFPVAWAMYHANHVPEKKWKTGTYPIEYHQRIVLAENEDRSDSYVEAWIENNKQKETRGQQYPVDVKDITWVKKVYSDKKFMFNPRASMSMVGGNEEVFPGLGLSWFSYGKTKRDMDWRFLNMGVGGSSTDFFFHISPLEYNVGEFLPVVENIFFGPNIGLSSDTDTNYGLSVSIPF